MLAAGPFLVVRDSPDRADICLVLGGPKHRTIFAIQLYHQNLCSKLLFINGHENGKSLAKKRQALALKHNVRIDDLIIDLTPVDSTYTELAQLKVFLDSDPLTSSASISLVSDAYHMRRTKMVFHWIFGNQRQVHMAAVPFDLSTFKRRWWSDPSTRKLVTLEYVKLVFYLLRYRLPFAPLNDWLARLERHHNRT